MVAGTIIMLDEPSSQDYPRQYLEGIRLFNEREFFECHDVIEELWTETYGEERKFLQGLIQSAVALYHFGNDNLGGAKKMYLAARDKLQRYGESYWGLDLKQFLSDMDHCFEDVTAVTEGYPEGVTLREDRIPRMHFHKPGFSTD